MSTAGSSTARFNNFKRNPFITNKKNKTSNLETDVIMDNTAKVKKNDDSNSLDNEGNPKRGNKRGRRLYDKEDDNKNGKI